VHFLEQKTLNDHHSSKRKYSSNLSSRKQTTGSFVAGTFAAETEIGRMQPVGRLMSENGLCLHPAEAVLSSAGHFIHFRNSSFSATASPRGGRHHFKFESALARIGNSTQIDGVAFELDYSRLS
jgi:hypothetical protein